MACQMCGRRQASERLQSSRGTWCATTTSHFREDTSLVVDSIECTCETPEMRAPRSSNRSTLSWWVLNASRAAAASRVTTGESSDTSTVYRDQGLAI